MLFAFDKCQLFSRLIIWHLFTWSQIQLLCHYCIRSSTLQFNSDQLHNSTGCVTCVLHAANLKSGALNAFILASSWNLIARSVKICSEILYIYLLRFFIGSEFRNSFDELCINVICSFWDRNVCAFRWIESVRSVAMNVWCIPHYRWDQQMKAKQFFIFVQNAGLRYFLSKAVYEALDLAFTVGVTSCSCIPLLSFEQRAVSHSGYMHALCSYAMSITDIRSSASLIVVISSIYKVYCCR